MIDLKNASRELHHAALIKRRGKTDWTEIKLFLLDHVMLMTLPRKGVLGGGVQGGLVATASSVTSSLALSPSASASLSPTSPSASPQDDVYHVIKTPFHYAQLTLLSAEDGEAWSAIHVDATGAGIAADVARVTLSGAARAVTTFETISRRIRGSGSNSNSPAAVPVKQVPSSSSSVTSPMTSSASSFAFAVVAVGKKMAVHVMRAGSVREKEQWMAVIGGHVDEERSKSEMYAARHAAPAGFVVGDARATCATVVGTKWKRKKGYRRKWKDVLYRLILYDVCCVWSIVWCVVCCVWCMLSIV